MKNSTLTQLMRFAVVACATGAAIFGVEWATGMDDQPTEKWVFFDLSDLTDAPDEVDEAPGYEGEADTEECG